jgi:hypothetical protein
LRALRTLYTGCAGLPAINTCGALCSCWASNACCALQASSPLIASASGCLRGSDRLLDVVKVVVCHLFTG